MAWALLTHTAVASPSSDTTVTTSAIDTTGAKIIVIFAGGDMRAAVTDSQSNTNIYRCPQAPSTGAFGINTYVIVNPTTNASHTFTNGPISNNFPTIAVMAFSGSFGGMELQTTSHSASTQTRAPGSITPSTNNALLVTAMTGSSDTGTRTINASFTVADSANSTAHAGSIASGYLIQTTAGAANPTWTTTAAATDIVAVMVSILLGGAGGGGGSTGGSYGFA